MEKPRGIKQSHCSQISHNIDYETGREEISTQRNDGYEEIPLKISFMQQKFESFRTYHFQKRKGRVLKCREDSIKVELKSLYMYKVLLHLR